MKRVGLGCGGLIVLLFVVAAIAGSSGTRKSGGTSSVESVQTTTAPRHIHPRAHRSEARRRPPSPCLDITRSGDASCSFAGAVKRAYLAHPDGTEVVYSPVTHESYSMRCLQATGVVTCGGGVNDSARVAFKGPPGPGTALTTSTTSTAQPGNTGNTGNTGGANNGNSGGANTGNSGGANTGNTGTSGNTGCHPLTDGGNCYEPGEYCRDSDHGVTGVAGDGDSITCEDNDGWRWEPN